MQMLNLWDIVLGVTGIILNSTISLIRQIDLSRSSTKTINPQDSNA